MNGLMKAVRKYAIHILLFFLTLASMMVVGAEFLTPKIVIDGETFAKYGWFPGISESLQLSWAELLNGLPYALAFLTFLTVHEFGHYITAWVHRVKCTLPYFIPMYIPLGIFNIGTFGAVIRLKEVPRSTRSYFDIGIAGPLAGFLVSLGLLIYGLAHLPPQDSYLLGLNPDYVETFGGVPSEDQIRNYAEQNEGYTYYIGTNLLFEILKQIIPEDPSQVPNHFELIHYPYLFVGFLSLFFTALNLLPIGQLDGGHVIYGLFGRKAGHVIAQFAVLGLLILGGIGIWKWEASSWEIAEVSDHFFPKLLYLSAVVYVLLQMWGVRTVQVIVMTFVIISIQVGLQMIFPNQNPSLIWMVYAFMLVRFMGIVHPPAVDEHRLDFPRQILGWIAIAIFILSFTPVPLGVAG